MTFKLQFLTKKLKWKTFKQYSKIMTARRYLHYYDNKFPDCTWRVTTYRPRKYWLQLDYRSKMIVIKTRKTLSII